MEHRNKITDIDYRTPLQWAKDKKIVNTDAVGIEMWSNANHYKSFLYYTPEQVHEGTAEELESFWQGNFGFLCHTHDNTAHLRAGRLRHICFLRTEIQRRA